MTLPRLISVEGPGCVGKTTTARSVLNILRAANVETTAVPEFSRSPLGTALEELSFVRHTDNSSWRLGLSGLLCYVADKVGMLEGTPPGTRVIVMDRSLVSQWILGMPSVPSNSQEHAEIILSTGQRWFESVTGSQLLLLLRCDIDELAKRCEARFGRRLTLDEVSRLRYVQQAYEQLETSTMAVSLVLEMDTTRTEPGHVPPEVASKLIQWALQ